MLGYVSLGEDLDTFITTSDSERTKVLQYTVTLKDKSNPITAVEYHL